MKYTVNGCLQDATPRPTTPTLVNTFPSCGGVEKTEVRKRTNGGEKRRAEGKDVKERRRSHAAWI